MDKIKLVLTKEVKDTLIELCIYEKWLFYTKKKFDSLRSFNNETACKSVVELQDALQSHINNNLIHLLIHRSFSWHGTQEGYDWWDNLFMKIKSDWNNRE